ncbi:MAG: peptide-methionine (S)-S-oxide reductase MsrA [Arenimonas sp.]|nr:peptide-methionine (S)-S-oxide reductase MsrA [Arenimonas sp.]
MNLTAFTGPLKVLGILALFAAATATLGNASSARQAVPGPRLDAPLAGKAGLQTAVFAGGCFWGIEAVFEHVEGVRDASSGYAGGSAASADYATVSAGRSAHAESVKLVFDPSIISYGQLLKIFFSVAHDPTQLNRQGPDRGRQYRSAIFSTSPEQQRIATAYIAQMTAAKTFGDEPIVTRVEPLRAFFPAEEYHQDFARLNPTHPYITYWDAPKVAALKREFPAWYRSN